MPAAAPANTAGQAMSLSNGKMSAGLITGQEFNVFCLIGELSEIANDLENEAKNAANMGFSNLCTIISIASKETNAVRLMVGTWRNFGWNIIVVNTEDSKEIAAAFIAFKNETEKPTLIISH